jgi:hypothetical protein
VPASGSIRPRLVCAVAADVCAPPWLDVTPSNARLTMIVIMNKPFVLPMLILLALGFAGEEGLVAWSPFHQ